jgi:hypothetical protein
MNVEPQLAAVTRSLEMLLDQLYYWARRAVDRRHEGADSEVIDRMLALATENLEHFVTTLLDCFRTIELAPAAMPTSELVAGLVRRARDEVGTASVVVAGSPTRPCAPTRPSSPACGRRSCDASVLGREHYRHRRSGCAQAVAVEIAVRQGGAAPRSWRRTPSPTWSGRSPSASSSCTRGS